MQNEIRYFIELAYKGTNYHGWQVQPNAISVQELLNTNISKVLQENVNVVGAGRTDTGVHASFFVAHLNTKKAIRAPEQLAFKLNRMLPKDIVVFRVYEVKPNFHARFDALSRTYKYYVSREKDPFQYDNQLQYSFDLDIDLMNLGAEKLLNYTDFTSFSKLHTQVKTNDCNVTHAKWEQHSNQLIFTITADRFLRNMVRAVVGSLFEVGRKKITLSQFESVIKAKNRSKAGASAPPQALFLYDIKYPKEYGVMNPHIF